MMRTYHRWISVPLVLMLFLVTLTGIYLQVVELQMATSTPAARPLARTAPDQAGIVAAVERSLALAAASNPGFPLQKIEISFGDGRYEAKLLTNQRIGPSITVTDRSDATTYVDRPKRTVRTIFVLLHSGKYFGAFGLFVILLAGLVFLVLCVTGAYVYVEMYRRRARAGKSGLFWR